MDSTSSPYLAANDRLADVIAAIQVMGTYKFYKLDFDTWADRICGDRTEAAHWREVFEQHPEFFRLDSGRKRASLVWRRQRIKHFDVDKGAAITKEAYLALSEVQKARISRMPLNSEELEMLITTAINLHARALEHKQDSRWKINALIGFLGALAGGMLAALIPG
jgi:hypothetical protein